MLEQRQDPEQGQIYATLGYEVRPSLLGAGVTKAEIDLHTGVPRRHATKYPAPGTLRYVGEDNALSATDLDVLRLSLCSLAITGIEFTAACIGDPESLD